MILARRARQCALAHARWLSSSAPLPAPSSSPSVSSPGESPPPAAPAVHVTAKPLVPERVVSHPYTTGGMRYMPGFSIPVPRSLDQIVKLALLEREAPARVREIWREYHDHRLDAVAAVWTREEMAGIAERKRRCPRFVYPVLKGDGKYFSLVAEWQDRFCLFSYLEDYKRSPAAAEPWLSVALYDDLLPRKQLVLLRGDFSGHLTKRDAAHVLNLMRWFYFREPKWVEAFNRDPRAFDWAAMVAACPPPPDKWTPAAGRLVEEDDAR